MKNSVLKKYVNEIKYFLNIKLFYIPIILVSIFSYGFVITHYSVNIDTLSANRYFEEGALIGQGRITATLLHKIFSVMEFNPFFVDGLAIIILIISALVLCVLFKKITNDKLSLGAYIVFSCLFLSYPIINEIFVYTPAGLSIALGFFMISISLIFIYECINNFTTSNILYATLLLFLAISLYESFLPVYLVGCFIILILCLLNNNLKLTLKEICIMLLPVTLSLTLYLLIPKILMLIFNIMPNNNAQKDILYSTYGLFEGLKNLAITMLEKYCINGLFYIPITVFMVSFITAIIMGIVLTIKRKNSLYLVLFLGLIVSTISLSILQGEASAYRTCQSFQIFCAFIIMLLYNMLISYNKRILINISTLIIALLVFYQVKCLHTTFYLNYMRYEEEKNTLVKVCNEIELNYDTNKPVLFLGSYQLSDYITSRIYVKADNYKMKIARDILQLFNIDDDIYNNDYKYIETNINPYLEWSQAAFGEANTEIFKWIDMLGYKLKRGTMEMLLEAVTYVSKLGTFQNEHTQIIETENYIIVNI